MILQPCKVGASATTGQARNPIPHKDDKHLANAPRSTLRNHYRHKRRSLRPAQQKLAARRLASIVCAQPAFLRAQSIAAYLACDGEIDLDPLIERAWRAGKKVFIPAINNCNTMDFTRFRNTDQLVTKKWGLREIAKARQASGQPCLDLVLTPLVAFDLIGNRLGRGGGHYDRFFARYIAGAGRTKKSLRRPLILGVAHSCQQTDLIPAQAWDVPLDAVATDRGIHFF